MAKGKDKKQKQYKKIDVSINNSSVKPEPFDVMLQRVRSNINKPATPKSTSPFLLDLSGATPKKIIQEDTPKSTLASSLKHIVKKLPVKQKKTSTEADKPVPHNWNHELKFFRDVMTLKHAKNEQAFVKMIPEAHIEPAINISPKKQSRVAHLIEQWQKSKNFLHIHKVQLTSLVLVYMLVASPVLAAAYYHKLASTGVALKDSIAATEQIVNSDAPLDHIENVLANAGIMSDALRDLDNSFFGLLDALPRYGEPIAAVSSLLDSREEMYELSQTMITELQEIQKNPDATVALHFAVYKLPDYTEKLDALLKPLTQIDPLLLPENYREKYQSAKDAYFVLTKALGQLSDISDFAASALGSQHQKRYLVMFQNNYELRASGGFLGSYALIDVFEGKIKNIEVPAGGLYDLQGQLTTSFHPPKPLSLITDKWETHDANWYFDWPMSAQKIQEFYYASGGPTVDGIITINTNVLKQILKITGPVHIPSHNQTVSDTNFFDVLQNEVEFGNDKQKNTPKKIIGNLLNEILPKLNELNLQQRLSLIQNLLASFDSKDIMMWLSDSEQQEKVLSFGWAGEIKQTQRDYLAIVESNIGGAKTNGVIDQHVHLHSDIKNDGSIINTLTITRTHNGILGDPLTGVNNIEYLRVYVPWKSRLIKAEGFSKPPRFAFEDTHPDYNHDEQLLSYERKVQIEDLSGTDIYETHGKTAYGNWIQLKPGESQQITLVYELPFTLGFPAKKTQSWSDYITGEDSEKTSLYHSILIQKQSGNWDPHYHVTLKYPRSWDLTSPSEIDFVQQKDALIPFIFTR